MWRMLQADEPSDYVLAAGEGDTVRVLRVAFSHVGLTRQDHVKCNENFERPAEVDALIGDATATRQELGWKARANCREFARSMVGADIDDMRRFLALMPGRRESPRLVTKPRRGRRIHWGDGPYLVSSHRAGGLGGLPSMIVPRFAIRQANSETRGKQAGWGGGSPAQAGSQSAVGDDHLSGAVVVHRCGQEPHYARGRLAEPAGVRRTIWPNCPSSRP
jgi:hypothetical protein